MKIINVTFAVKDDKETELLNSLKDIKNILSYNVDFIDEWGVENENNIQQ